MLNELVNRLRGQVWIRAESAFPERVLNLCGARDLAFWDLAWESPTAFTCRLSRRDWHTLRRAAANLECTLSVVGREGAPYFLVRFRRRQVLLAGLALCAAGLFFGSFFVWEFRIEGNETVPTERILRALEQNGVHLGSFGLSLDGEDIRNHVLLEIPEAAGFGVFLENMLHQLRPGQPSKAVRQGQRCRRPGQVHQDGKDRREQQTAEGVDHQNREHNGQTF